MNVNRLRSCSLEVESTIHFSLHCDIFEELWQVLLETVEKIIKDISHLNDDLLTNKCMEAQVTALKKTIKL